MFRVPRTKAWAECRYRIRVSRRQLGARLNNDLVFIFIHAPVPCRKTGSDPEAYENNYCQHSSFNLTNLIPNNKTPPHASHQNPFSFQD